VATNVGGLAEQLSTESLAILCEPDATSFANGLRLVLDMQHSALPPPARDSADGWQEIGRSLLDQTDAVLRKGAGGIAMAREAPTAPLTSPGSSATAARPWLWYLP
jgi:hypothetical protein